MLGELIGSFIKEKGMTQTGVAERAGLSKQALSDIVHGRRKIEATEYFSLCRALGCSINFFYEKLVEENRKCRWKKSSKP